MKKLIILTIFVMAGSTTFAGQNAAPAGVDGIARLRALADDARIMNISGCFLSGEKRDGLNKICFYSCVSGDSAITVGSAELCPLSM